MNGRETDTGISSGVRGGLTRRLPAWVTLLVAVVITVVLGGLLLSQQMNAVRLDPAIGGAQRIEMRLELCNTDVDDLDINPRESELDIAETFRDEGAGDVQVRLDRRDCPPGAADADADPEAGDPDAGERGGSG